VRMADAVAELGTAPAQLTSFRHCRVLL